MRTLLLVLSVIVSLHSVTVNAQKLFADFDSLTLTKPKPARPTFVFPSSEIGTASLVYGDPMSTDLPPPRRRLDGLATLLTGISLGESYSTNILRPHEINVDDPLKSWRVHLFCSGTRSTDTERVRNDDGSFSLNKTKTLYLNWDSGAAGYVLEQSDTIGAFLIIRDPSSDQQSASWLMSLEQRYEIPVIATGPGAYDFVRYQDYALYGKLRDKYFHIVVSGSRWASLIQFDEKPAAMYRSDFNHVVITGKRWRIAPYLLVDKSLDETSRADVMRLAMLSWLTTRSLAQTSY